MEKIISIIEQAIVDVLTEVLNQKREKEQVRKYHKIVIV